MEYQALYRKYRPHCFEDFIDQDNTKKILINSILNNNISHAYLFSGPRGIGKTSMAKIFAKAINCLEFNKKNDVCCQCVNCLEADNSVDIIEMDAASNNGVDQIRDLKNNVLIVPSKLKYKVYIIDEVHMLTNSAFNALLKTLEEPPSHVVFILATTEFYSVPETIVSRCQCFNFFRVSNESLQKRLKYISEKEQIQIDDDVLKEIALSANGGFRDGIGMLDKLHSFTKEKITMDIFERINGIVSLTEIKKFYDSLLNNDRNEILQIIDALNENGLDLKNFVERLMYYVRDLILAYYKDNSKIIGKISDNILLIETLNDILNRLKETVNPYIIMQIYFLKYIENINIVDKSDVKEHKKEEETSKIISREIITNKNTVKNDNLNDLKNNIESKKQVISKKTSFNINENIKNIRINNAMASANINFKRELVDVWKSLDKYFIDEKYSKVAQLLSDCTVMVVGDDYCILTALSDGIINKIYQNFNICEELIKNMYHKLSIIVIKDEEFDTIKNKYIEDKKNNIVYQIKEESGKLIEEDGSLLNQAINIFGSDVVEID